MDTKEFLKRLSEASGVSGSEGPVCRIAGGVFNEYADDVRVDMFGNLLAVKRGQYEGPDGPPKVMIAAHSDEIGFMVTAIEKGGFLRFTPVGGIDQRILPGQEVLVYGKETVTGVIGAKPPHVQAPGESNRVVKMEDLFIDIGLPEDRVKEIIKVGDIATFKRRFMELGGSMVAGKSMDDRAGVAVILEVLKELRRLRHRADLYAVATVQEEVGTRGALVSSYSIAPDIGIAIDVTHGDMEGVPKRSTVAMGGGPAIGIGPHVHPKLYEKFVSISKELRIPHQIDPSPRPGGTDAWAIQIARSGVASALISIPLRYMHTSVEVASMDDIKESGRLIASFIARIDKPDVEELRCF